MLGAVCAGLFPLPEQAWRVTLDRKMWGTRLPAYQFCFHAAWSHHPCVIVTLSDVTLSTDCKAICEIILHHTTLITRFACEISTVTIYKIAIITPKCIIIPEISQAPAMMFAINLVYCRSNSLIVRYLRSVSLLCEHSVHFSVRYRTPRLTPYTHQKTSINCTSKTHAWRHTEIGTFALRVKMIDTVYESTLHVRSIL